MDNAWGAFVVSLLLVAGNAFFVAAEYSLVSARRGKIESLARKGHGGAKLVLKALQNLSRYVAGVQIAITMFGIGVGAVTEPFVTYYLGELVGAVVPGGVRVLIAILIVTFVLVVVGELVPKYATLASPEKIALLTIRPLTFFVWALSPLVALVQATGSGIMRILGIDMKRIDSDAVPKEELLMLVQAGGTEGILEKRHAELVTRALKLDALDARDIMIHRLDMKWLDADLSKEDLLRKLKKIPYTRLPVCQGDIDDLVGVVYIHDIVKNLDDAEFSLRKILRPAVVIPENLDVEKIVEMMREQKTQIVIVGDEHGGTSGLITLEDVVEEVFGELEDRIESERPQIEQFPGGRVSARASIRLDELISRLELDIELDVPPTTLAQAIADGLGRVPRPGDAVESPIGMLRVENMARRRVTRVSVQLATELLTSRDA